MPQSTSARRPAVRLGVESLDCRDLPSVVVALGPDGKPFAAAGADPGYFLYVRGTGSSDAIEIEDRYTFRRDIFGRLRYEVSAVRVRFDGWEADVPHADVWGGRITVECDPDRGPLDPVDFGNDSVTYAGKQDLIVYAGGGQDTVVGGSGDDHITDGYASGPGKVYGMTGPISAPSGTFRPLDDGPDRFDGGAGDDTLTGGTGPDTLDGGAGDDVLHGGYEPFDALAFGFGRSLSADGRDVLTGGDGADDIRDDWGGASADAGAGDDVVLLGVGRLGYGGGGNYAAHGGDGHDNIRTGDGTDRLTGGDGNDTLDAGGGDDDLSGGAGADRLLGRAGDDDVRGGTENDTMLGGAGHDELRGGGGDDDLFGEAGWDWLWGNDGDDLLDGGADTDFAFGGTGRDETRNVRGDVGVIGWLFGYTSPRTLAWVQWPGEQDEGVV